MRRYVKTQRSAAGVTTVTVTLVDGELSARWTVKTYIGKIPDVVKQCEGYARQAMEEMQSGLEAL